MSLQGSDTLVKVFHIQPISVMCLDLVPSHLFLSGIRLHTSRSDARAGLFDVPIALDQEKVFNFTHMSCLELEFNCDLFDIQMV